MTLLMGNTGHSRRGWGPTKGLIKPRRRKGRGLSKSSGLQDTHGALGRDHRRRLRETETGMGPRSAFLQSRGRLTSLGVRRCVKKGPGGTREPAWLPGAPPQPGTKVFQQEEETGRKDSGGPLAYRAEDAPHLSRTAWNSHGEPRQEGRMGLLGRNTHL